MPAVKPASLRSVCARFATPGAPAPITTSKTPAAPVSYDATFNEAKCGGGAGVGMLLVMAGAAVGRWRRSRLTGRSGP